MGADEVTVAQASGAGRFEIHVDGDMAGLAAYVDAGSQRIFYHTQIEDAFAHRGLAARLADEALSQTVEAGLRIVPVCSYIARYVRTHHEFDDAVDPVTPAALEAVRAAAAE